MANRAPSLLRPTSIGIPSSIATAVPPRFNSAARSAGYQSPNTISAGGPPLANCTRFCSRAAFMGFIFAIAASLPDTASRSRHHQFGCPMSRF